MPLRSKRRSGILLYIYFLNCLLNLLISFAFRRFSMATFFAE